MFGKKNELGQEPDFQFFTIFDSKTSSYAEPMPAKNSQDMVRALLNMFSNPKQATNQYLVNAEDFSLFKIGSFDKKTGQLSAQQLEHVVNLHELRSLIQERQQEGIVAT